MISNPGNPMGIFDTAKLTAGPHLQSFTPKNITSSFSIAGLTSTKTMVFNEDES